jgi:putative transposase
MEKQTKIGEQIIVQQKTNKINQYTRNKRSVGVAMFHLEWCTKYRYKMFRKLKYKNLIDACIRRAASMHDIKIIELGVEPEHVHCSVEIKVSKTASWATQILKGFSAKKFFEFCPNARLRYPKGHLWSRGKFISSVGFVQLETVNNYIRGQAIHHNTIFIE